MKVSGAAARALLVALVALAGFGGELVREATSPSGFGYWTAMAAAPGGGLYVADERRQRLIRVDGGGAQTAGRLPQAIYRALAADGDDLLLGTESGLFSSHDGGASWAFVVPSRRFTAVWVGGGRWLAAAWDDGIYRSSDGSSWTRARSPAGDTQFQAIDCCRALTLLGLLAGSPDGASWEQRWAHPRMTALDGTGGDSPRLADWNGNVYEAPAALAHHYPGGVWALAGDLVATAQGLWRAGQREPGRLGRVEVTRVVVSGGNRYAAVARGPILVDRGDFQWVPVYQP